MEVAVTKGTNRTTGASKGCSRIAKPSSSSSPSSSASTWGHVDVRVLMHRDLITCQFFRSQPRSWQKKYWHRLRRESNKHPSTSPSTSSSSPPPPWSSPPFSLSSLPFSSRSSSVSSHFLSLLFSRISSLAVNYRDREREHLGPASSQALDGHAGFSSTPGMTISPWGPSTQPTAAYSTSSTAVLASSLGHSLRHHNSSGWVSLPCKLDFSSPPQKACHSNI